MKDVATVKVVTALAALAAGTAFAADDPAKNVYDWADAAKADWKAFFDAIPHEGTDEGHAVFYTDRYFKETE